MSVEHISHPESNLVRNSDSWRVGHAAAVMVPDNTFVVSIGGGCYLWPASQVQQISGVNLDSALMWLREQDRGLYLDFLARMLYADEAQKSRRAHE